MDPIKSLKLRLEYVGLKVLLFAVNFLPYSAAVKSGETLGSLMAKIMPKRYKRAVRDISKAFPEKSPQEINQIAFESWKNMGRVTAEFIKAVHLPREVTENLVELRNFGPVFEQEQKNSSALVQVGHFANWELFGLVMSIKFKMMSFIARPQNNPYVDKELNRLRTIFGGKMVSAYNPFFSCFRTLKKGSLMGILSDQSAPSSKLYMDFLNRPAEVAPMTAMLALKLNLPIFLVRLFRENGKIVAEVEETIPPQNAAYTHEAMKALTVRLKNKYEEWIRRDPASWLWAHNRWKREKDSLAHMRREQQKQQKAAQAQAALQDDQNKQTEVPHASRS